MSAPTLTDEGAADDAPGIDPYLWLEDVTGERALAWVRERNAETLATIATGERFGAMRDEILEVLDSAEKLPGLHWRGEHLYNFWQDETHPRGLWRRTTVDRLRGGEWEVLLDLDELAAAEGENWVWGGAHELRPDNERYLIKLSRGGADATVVREFHIEDGFVTDGFTVPEAKTWLSWIDIDNIFVATDFGPGSLTGSGYPRLVKRWRRGTPLSQAQTVFEARADDMIVTAEHDATPGFERDIVERRFAFFDADVYLLDTDGGLTRLEIPTDAGWEIHREWLLVRLRTPWQLGERLYPAGMLLATRLDDFVAGAREFTVLFEPTADTVLQYWSWTRHHLVLGLLRNVHSELVVLDPELAWTRTALPGVPEHDYTLVSDSNPDHTDEVLLISTGFASPSTLRHGTVSGGVEPLLQEPTFFDANGLRVEQLWAASADGTRVPYFRVSGPRADGPTLLDAYGGFEISRTPGYDGGLGRAWLSRGGSYVVANIRGGGEFGPAWHLAALRENRPRAFEDLAAVAQDLVERGLTTPARLGVTGGSNGGLLMGVMLTRYPSLFGAVVGNVPLLDMRRYHLLLAGASWVAEYGDPDSDDWEFLQQYSPYHNVQDAPGVGDVHNGHRYPPALWITSTRDDRVHPAHARKMTALLRAAGQDVAYYENIEGGHSAAADNAQRAFRRALAFEFLWRHLDPGNGPS
jgi:prolyl oligopeptidase